jgi:hypothetical protein
MRLNAALYVRCLSRYNLGDFPALQLGGVTYYWDYTYIHVERSIYQHDSIMDFLNLSFLRSENEVCGLLKDCKVYAFLLQSRRVEKFNR